MYGLPEDYFSTYIERVQAVTVEDVHQAAQRYIQPDMFAIVVVGDRTKIEPSIRALDLGPVKAIGVREALP